MLAGGNAKRLKKSTAKRRERAALTIQCAGRQASARAEVRDTREARSRREAKARRTASLSNGGGVEARRQPSSAAAASVSYPAWKPNSKQRSVKKAEPTRWPSGERDYTHLEAEEGGAEGVTMAEFLAIVEEEDDQEDEGDEGDEEESRLRAVAWAREQEATRGEDEAARILTEKAAAKEARAKRVVERQEAEARTRRIQERTDIERQSKEAAARAAREQEEEARKQRVAAHAKDEEARQQRAAERAKKADAKRAADSEREEAKRNDETEATRKFLKERVNLKERKNVDASRTREQAGVEKPRGAYGRADKPISPNTGSGLAPEVSGSKARTQIHRSKSRTSSRSWSEDDAVDSSTTTEGSPLVLENIRQRIVAAKRRASARFAEEALRAKVRHPNGKI